MSEHFTNKPSATLPVVQAPSRIAAVFDQCVLKVRSNLPALAATPASWGFDREGDYAARNEGFFDIENWTSSFFTGMGVLSYLRTGDAGLLAEMEGLEEVYREKVGRRSADTMHDLGFLYSLYSVALHKVTGEAKHRELGLQAAEVLADRFVPEGSYLQAWGRMGDEDSEYLGLAIIDSVMNLPLLYWATEESGDPRFRDIAIQHAETSLKYFLRPDGSVAHAFRFESGSGDPIGVENYCGRSKNSHWARGAAWAMYGFSLAYKEVGDQRHLDAAQLLARRFVELLDEELVPVWDFKLKDGELPLRDSSAAAIACCAIQSLERMGAADPEMIAAKGGMLAALCSEAYFDSSPSCRGFLRRGEVGDGIGKAQSVYCSWGDYFFMEALGREMGLEVNWW